MNRDFLSNFERQDPTPEETVDATGSSPVESVEFEDGEYFRNVCFIWPNGRRKFIPYSRLDSGEINEEHEAIRLVFGTETANIIGIRLLPLFSSFMEHKRKFVYCDDPRYNDINDDEIIVNDIVFTQNS